MKMTFKRFASVGWRPAKGEGLCRRGGGRSQDPFRFPSTSQQVPSSYGYGHTHQPTNPSLPNSPRHHAHSRLAIPKPFLITSPAYRCISTRFIPKKKTTNKNGKIKQVDSTSKKLGRVVHQIFRLENTLPHFAPMFHKARRSNPEMLR